MSKLGTVGKHFGDWLRSCREAKGLSIRGLADAADMPHTLVHWLESGKREPTHEARQKLAAGLGVSVADVYIASYPDQFSEQEREYLRRWLSDPARPC